MRYAIGVIAGLVLGAAATAALSAGTALPPEVARFQVVNPTPTFRGSTMLVDTARGATWIVCGKSTDKDATPPGDWCPMSGGPAGHR